MKRAIIYNVTNMPPGVDVRNIRFVTRSRGPNERDIKVIFKCKDDCKTIFTNKNLKEMQ